MLGRVLGSGFQQNEYRREMSRMDISRVELVSRFRLTSDEDLTRRLTACTLTPLAVEIAEAELRLRGVNIFVNRSADVESSDEHEDAPEADLVTVAIFSNPLQASVLPACLESEGVFAHVWGEHLGIANIFPATQPFRRVPRTAGAGVADHQSRHQHLPHQTSRRAAQKSRQRLH